MIYPLRELKHLSVTSCMQFRSSRIVDNYAVAPADVLLRNYIYQAVTILAMASSTTKTHLLAARGLLSLRVCT